MNKEAQNLKCTYSEFPQFFVWKADKRMWKIREQGDSIGRIVTAHPTEGERYYLRLLLTKVRCPTSFFDVRTFNGVQTAAFPEATLLRGYLQHDDSQQLCLQEASLFHMPYEMSRLFATLLVYLYPNDPMALWLKFEDVMSEDYARLNILTASQIRVKVLEQINGFLESMGKNISSYNLVPPSISFTDVENETRELRAERSIAISANDLNAIAMLNTKQKEAFKIISERVYTNKRGAFFIAGLGGTGKTFLYRALLANVRSKAFTALATTTSDIATSILPEAKRLILDLRHQQIFHLVQHAKLANKVH
ncbi:uncharacterized protein [Coffea arabica]|uniref:ATP-dependent DNA helicase n=1 Tax=Coffea arabica TaxID=13443 RepID=A0ABM4V3N9_COFAR